MNLCPNCHKNDAKLHPTYGVLACDECNERQSKLRHVGKQHEFTSEQIREERRAYADDIEQPHYKGALNKRWVEIYGEQAALDRGFTKDEIKKAKYTMDGLGLRYYNDKT